MTNLPLWAASNPCAREIIAALRRDPPDWRIVRDDWGTRDCPRFTGKLVSRLRRMREEWLERQIAALDAQFEVTGKWDDEASRAVFGSETADELIRRKLESGEEREAA